MYITNLIKVRYNKIIDRLYIRLWNRLRIKNFNIRLYIIW